MEMKSEKLYVDHLYILKKSRSERKGEKWNVKKVFYGSNKKEWKGRKIVTY